MFNKFLKIWLYGRWYPLPFIIIFNYCCVFSFHLILLYSIFILKPVVVVSAAPFDCTVDGIVASFHLAVDTVVSHFESVVVTLCFAQKKLFSTSPIISSFRSL